MPHVDDLLIDARIGDFAGHHIDPVELNDLIEAHGIGVEYRRAVWCPCARIETRRARATCPHCRGHRFTYPDDMREDLVVLVQNRNPTRAHVPAGELVTGMAMMTFPLGVVPAVGDMVLPCQEQHVVHETMWRARQQIDNTRVRRRATTSDQAAPKIEPEPERLLYPRILAIDHLHWIAGDKLCKASAADYELVGNEIRWNDGRGPTAGDGYSIRYRARAAYILNPGEPVYRQENSGAGWPYRVEAQRLDRWSDPSLRGDD